MQSYCLFPVVKAGQPSHGLSDLAGKKIAVVAGTTTEPALREALKKTYVNAEVITVSKHIDGLMDWRLCKGERWTPTPPTRPC